MIECVIETFCKEEIKTEKLIHNALSLIETSKTSNEKKRILEMLAIDIERIVRNEISEKLFKLANEINSI